jgi:aminoglycoside 6'-N-acetyltransferase
MICAVAFTRALTGKSVSARSSSGIAGLIVARLGWQTALVRPILRAGRVMLRPLEDRDLDQLTDILALHGVREWWSSLEDPEHTREGLRNDGAAFAIEVDGTLAGWLGYNEETDCDCRYASFDIFVAPEHQDQRVGRAALELATRWLFEERGHHRLTIDPALHNERAIRAYAAAGFRPVGVMRAYERGCRWPLARQPADGPPAGRNALGRVGGYPGDDLVLDL